MLSQSCAVCRASFALGLCIGFSGCIGLPYPAFQDVTGPLRGVRVFDAASKQEIPDAKASLNLDSCGLETDDKTFTILDLVDKDVNLFSGYRQFREKGLREGLLTRNEEGVFTIHRRIEPELGFFGFLYGDRPLYNKQATITAFAPGHRPLQVAFHATQSDMPTREAGTAADGGTFACKFDSKGILNFYLCRAAKESVSQASYASKGEHR